MDEPRNKFKFSLNSISKGKMPKVRKFQYSTKVLKKAEVLISFSVLIVRCNVERCQKPEKGCHPAQAHQSFKETDEEGCDSLKSGDSKTEKTGPGALG